MGLYRNLHTHRALESSAIEQTSLPVGLLVHGFALPQCRNSPAIVIERPRILLAFYCHIEVYSTHAKGVEKNKRTYSWFEALGWRGEKKGAGLAQ